MRPTASRALPLRALFMLKLICRLSDTASKGSTAMLRLVAALCPFMDIQRAPLDVIRHGVLLKMRPVSHSAGRPAGGATWKSSQ